MFNIYIYISLTSPARGGKIGHFGNFDFWSKVNAKKSKSTGLESKSTVKVLTG